MRHLKADVSHRMRRRPSIFSTRWFRLVLGAGALVIVSLFIGPSVVNNLRARPATRIAVPSPGPIGPALKRPQVAQAPQGPQVPQMDVERPEPTATVRPTRPEAPVPPSPATNGPAVTNGQSPATAAIAAATAPVPGPAAAAAPAPASAPALPAPVATRPKAPTADGADPVTNGVFRIQVGAFLDHRNADRLVARLRNENFEVLDSVTEQSRVLYRVLATPRPGEGYDSLLAEIKRHGFAPEMKGDSAVVTGPIPMREAVEASRALKDRGLRISLERQTSSGSFRVVRVGEFTTAEEAERTRAELARRGLEGIVVREK